jgi:hypothetical protein
VLASHAAMTPVAPPNKRMQLAALQFKGTSDSAQAGKSPQLMRGPLGARDKPPASEILTTEDHIQVRVLVATVILLAGCGSEPNSGAPCPEPSGEFPPTHCAFVTGRLTAGGTPMAGAGLRVDDFVAPVGYAYASDAASTDAEGRFSLLVLRLNEFRAPTVPDTATVYVKVYSGLSAAQPGAPTTDSLPVVMSFAPMGTVVDTTEAELTLP